MHYCKALGVPLTFQRPLVEEVRYDIDADRLYWKGPDRKIDVDWRVARFITEFFKPSYQWQPKA
jgi:hypothetical protein